LIKIAILLACCQTAAAPIPVAADAEYFTQGGGYAKTQTDRGVD
jgi:hypothetical protein